MTQQYVGTKIVTAWPENQQGRDGYAVKYADGYKSWSPKDTFEEAYRPLGDISHLEPWQQRVVAELVELKDKIGKLSMFMQCDTFKHRDEHTKLLLEQQYMCMSSYADVLQERISLFTPAPIAA
ncbi:hypothetical protein [Dyella sp.]|uniref:crAss001_48 related protein n=1 Tax=Dyella sp. TaxID=1869338 RepID=UPI002FDAF128